MDIRLFNTMTNQIEPFEPLIPGQVSMYVCGPTVYNFVHIGNMRPVVVFDTLRRFFEYVGYDVTYVSNYTDIDDKIILRASEEGISEVDVAEKYIKAFEEVVATIHSKKATHTPRVTKYVQQIIDFIVLLIEKGAAYAVDGDVYFRVASDHHYGELANVKMDDLVVGARVEENSRKEAPLDFALWKKTDTGISWPSPWGQGRPGWHTECVVMIHSLFPKHFIDIHGGGFDLKFPHHTNEIAQSEVVAGNSLARYWMHNGFVNINNEKMSKSLGNSVTAKDLLTRFGGNAIRLLLLSTHYRAPVNFADEVVESGSNELQKMETTFRQLAVFLQLNKGNVDGGSPEYIQPFLQALADDLNTSNALAEVFKVLKEVNQYLRNKEKSIDQGRDYFKTLKDMFSLLGLEFDYPILTKEDNQLYQDYLAAKTNKNFELSDQLRKQLIEKKIL